MAPKEYMDLNGKLYATVYEKHYSSPKYFKMYYMIKHMIPKNKN